jgi:hypothetical protein
LKLGIYFLEGTDAGLGANFLNFINGQIASRRMKILMTTIAFAGALFFLSGCIHVTVIKTTPEEAQNLSTNTAAVHQLEKQ